MRYPMCLGWLVAVVVVVAAAYTEAQEHYEEGRFAHINVDEVISNQRILVSFIKCFLDQGPCTADARDMKKLLPEVIDSHCAKCTKKQKQLMAKAVIFVKENRPNDWVQLVNKYDPNHDNEKVLDDFLKEALA